jgi:hypothetical protein
MDAVGELDAAELDRRKQAGHENPL